jgi:hypothetical protein
VNKKTFSRREVLTALASTAALPWLPPFISAYAAADANTAVMGTADTAALALRDQCADHLLALFPESATSLGIDNGSRAELRSQLTDRSAAGQQRIAEQIRSDLRDINTFDSSGLSPSLRTSLSVVQSAYSTALEGFALPYGDITVGSWPSCRRRRKWPTTNQEFPRGPMVKRFINGHSRRRPLPT